MSRLFTLGIIALAVGFIVGVGGELVRDEPAVAPAPPAQVSVVDVAHGVDAAALSQLVRLAPDERVIAVDDRPVANDLAAGAAIATQRLDTGRYIDLTVGSARGQRRVLVLLH